MTPYKAAFAIGADVRIADASRLTEFQQTWRYHHKLTAVQIKYAGVVTRVDKIGYYHGGDVLYWLRDVPGTWHEQCLYSAASEP